MGEVPVHRHDVIRGWMKLQGSHDARPNRSSQSELFLPINKVDIVVPPASGSDDLQGAIGAPVVDDDSAWMFSSSPSSAISSPIVSDSFRVGMMT